MKSLGDIELTLSRLGVRNQFFGRAEIKELRHILTDDEVITNAVNGRYENGFCLMVATDRRLLLIDKKMWFLSIEDVRFDMITELDYCARLLDATLSVRTINKIMRVTSFKPKLLREMTTYLQARVMELRHMQAQPQQEQSFTGQASQYQPNQVRAYSFNNSAQQFAIPQTTLTPAQPTQQLYSTQITEEPARPRFKRIGAYPTSSLTMQRKF